MSSFVHLHTHTEFSILDGAAKIEDVIDAAVADGQPALGITDHGNMYGVIEFYKACHRKGIKPIIGTEAYMALESKDERPKTRGKRSDDSGGDTESGQKLYYHLTLLAESNEGYQNLMKLSSKAFMEGYYYKPRMDWEMLQEHSKGLIATSGCLGSVVQQALLNKNYDEAVKRAGRLQDIFGKDNFYIEMQDHGINEQHVCNPLLLKIAEEIKAPLLATNDLHYTKKEDHAAHDALLCVQTKSLIDDEVRFRFDGSEHYLKSADEMRGLFSDIPVSCDNTLLIAERVNTSIEFGKSLLPVFPIPEGFKGEDKYLEHLVKEGAKQRWGKDKLSHEVSERLDSELRIISQMGFSAYFLIVWDLIKHAKEVGVRVGPGRGSAAGCAVAYCLGITEIDPIKYDLLFERFLNVGRVSMPDIDIDFDDRGREEMIRYSAKKYGRDHVAQVVTFGIIKAKSAIKDTARVMGLPYALGDKISKAVPPMVAGRDTPLHACLKKIDGYGQGYKAANEIRDIYEKDKEAKRIMDGALGIEGLVRQDSIHAAAVIIGPHPLVELLPLQQKPAKKGEDESPIISQYDMAAVESLGLLKMDFLGLKTLSIIGDTVEMINGKKTEDEEEFRIEDIPWDDPSTFALLSEGNSISVFQLESAPMRSLLINMNPTEFGDIAAAIALYRPGPIAAKMHIDYADRKNNRADVVIPHEDLNEILGETYGLMIYQESVMRVAQVIAGYTLHDADELRKACGKKDREAIAGQRKSFIEGGVKNGYDKKLCEDLFKIIEPFADYAFNKSHAYAYGLIAYQTAYLKANYPAEFTAATLTAQKNNIEKETIVINDAISNGLKILIPDVNESAVDFVNVGKEIRFGLSAIKSMGYEASKAIVEERTINGRYKDFTDFCARSQPVVLKKSYMEALIKTGAFDKMGCKRKGLLEVHEDIAKGLLRERREKEAGKVGLFEAIDEEEVSESWLQSIPIPDIEARKNTLLAWERNLLGMYLTGHPLAGAGNILRKYATHQISDLMEGGTTSKESGVKLAGVISDVKRKTTKRGDPMASFLLEDLTGSIPVTAFSSALQGEGNDILQNDAKIVASGRLEDNEEQDLKFLVSHIQKLDIGDVLDRDIMRINLSHSEAEDEAKIEELKKICNSHPGNHIIQISLGGDRIMELPECYNVDAESIKEPLKDLIG